MARLTSENPLKASLIRGLHGLERQLNMDRNDIMLILLELDSEEKIVLFMEWMLAHTEGGVVLVKPNEIVRAACNISDEINERDAAIQQLTEEMKKRGISVELINDVLHILETTENYLVMIDALSSIEEPYEKNLLETAKFIAEEL